MTHFAPLLGVCLLLSGCASSPTPEPAYNAGIAHLEQGETEAARRAFEAAIIADPDDDAAHRQLALLYSQRHEMHKALHHMEQAARLRPGNPVYWTDLALLYNNFGRNGDARRALARAIQVDRTMARPHYYRGLMAYDDGDYDAARAAFQEALRLDPAMAHAAEWLKRLEEQTTKETPTP